jgi:hypothetical protein
VFETILGETSASRDGVCKPSLRPCRAHLGGWPGVVCAWGSVRRVARVERRELGQEWLAGPFGLLDEEVQGGEEAFGGGSIQRAASGFDGVALAVGVEVAKGFAVGETGRWSRATWCSPGTR